MNLRTLILDSYRQMTSTTLRGRFARGAFWSFGASVFSSVLQLGAFVMVARYLAKEGFGELGIITSTVQMMGVFTGMSLSLTATRHVAEWRSAHPERAARIIALCLNTAAGLSGAVALLLIAFAPALATNVFQAAGLTEELRIAAGLIVLNTLMAVQNAVLAGLEAFRTMATVNLARGLLNFPATILGARFFGLPGALVGLMLGAAAGWLVGQRALRRECVAAGIPLIRSGGWQERHTLWRFSFPGLLSGVMSSGAVWLGHTLLVRQPTGFAEMGIFNAANQWRAAITFIPGVLSQVLLPVLSSLYGQRDTNRLTRGTKKALLLITACSASVALPVILFSHWIMETYGPGFSQGWKVLVLVSLSAVMAAAAAVVGTTLASADKLWASAVLNGIWAAVFLLAVLPLVRYGALGLAIAYVVSYSVHLLNCISYNRILLRQLTLKETEAASRQAIVKPAR